MDIYADLHDQFLPHITAARKSLGEKETTLAKITELLQNCSKRSVLIKGLEMDMQMVSTLVQRCQARLHELNNAYERAKRHVKLAEYERAFKAGPWC